jgi:hypothetical protein
MFTGAHKKQIMASALTPLETYHKVGDDFLNHIVQVTGDETRVSSVNVETKEQSTQWMQTHLPNRPKTVRNAYLPAIELMATAFWDRKRMTMVDFMQQGTTIASQVYFETLIKSVGPFRAKGVEC